MRVRHSLSNDGNTFRDVSQSTLQQSHVEKKSQRLKSKGSISYRSLHLGVHSREYTSVEEVIENCTQKKVTKVKKASKARPKKSSKIQQEPSAPQQPQPKAIRKNRAEVDGVEYVKLEKKDSSLNGAKAYSFVSSANSQLNIRVLSSNSIDKRSEKAFKAALVQQNKKKIKLSEKDKVLYQTAISRDEEERILPSSIEIRKINDAIGYGLFAKQQIEKNTILGEYVGTIKTNKLINAEDEGGAYSFALPKESAFTNFGIDARSSGNFARFINHGGPKKSNIYTRIYYDEKGPHIFYITDATIKAGTQLLVDYGKDYCWGDKKVFQKL